MKTAEAELPPSDRSDAPDAPIPTPAELRAPHSRIRIAGDVVNKATSELPEAHRNAVRRLHAYYAEKDLSMGELADETKISHTTISQVFNGKYPSKLDGVVESINAFFDLLEKRSHSRKLPFIKTKLTKRIWDICDAAVEFQKIAFIFGDSQIGKSEALKAYQAEHNHGSTIYVDMPTGGKLLNFLAKLAKKLRITDRLRITDLRRRIIEAFDDRMLLIVDEVHQCLPIDGYSSMRSLQSIEFVREIYNEKNCGVVLCGTNAFRQALDEGGCSRLLAQTKRRRFATLQLPEIPTQEDLNTFAKSYGLEPATGEARKLQDRMIQDEALGMWLTLLRMGAKISSKSNAREMTWDHVIKAYAGLRTLEGNK